MVVGVLLSCTVAGCSIGSSQYHDKLICQMFAKAMSATGSSGDGALWGRAFTQGRAAVRRHGYVSPRLEPVLRGMVSGSGNKLNRALPGFSAACQAVGVHGPVFPAHYASTY